MPALPVGTFSINQDGLITIDASEVGHAYLGDHTIKVKVAISASKFWDLTFTLKILNCVVTDLSLNPPLIQDISYTIGDSPKIWYYDQTFAKMTPLCPYSLDLSYQNLPTFVV